MAVRPDDGNKMGEMQFIASQTITASGNSADFDGRGFKGGCFSLVIAGPVTGTSPSLALKLQSKDPVSGAYIDVPGASFAAQTAAQPGIDLVVYPGIAELANRKVSTILPPQFRLAWTVTGTSPSFGGVTLGGCLHT